MIQRFSRTILIALSKAQWAKRMATKWRLGWWAASRFIAGETLEQALEVIRRLNDRGILATLDSLGEHTTNPDEARQAAEEVLQALQGIDASGVRSNVSIKLSQFGLTIDEDLCRDNLRRILECARERNIFIRIDMEDSSLTTVTLEMLKWAWSQGYTDVGIVLQAYLYRTAVDQEWVLVNGGRVRLCKGAYDEPENVAFPNKSDVDANYDTLALMLLEHTQRSGAPQISVDGRRPPIAAFATHDEVRIRYVQEQAKRLSLPRGALEFQMLHGIRRDLQDALAKQGYPVRVYVPYGTQWYPYFMRRLAERPANIGFLIRNFFRR